LIPGATAKIRPFLQSFTLGRPRYTADEVREQIRAAEDLGIHDWVMWNARGVYPAGAFRPVTRSGAAASEVASEVEPNRE
jgi:hypothetical protein